MLKKVISGCFAIFIIVFTILIFAFDASPIPYLQDVYKDYFSIGVCCKKSKIVQEYDLLNHYNSITPEYEMKWGINEPGSEKGTYFYDDADNLVKWAKENNKKMRGHALVWYQNVPKWFEKEATTKEKTLQLIEERINQLMTRYGDDVIYCWDVVNEAIIDAPTQEQVDSNDFYRSAENEPWRFGDDKPNTRFDFLGICGKDYIFESFKIADKVCQENNYDEMKLFYNDWFLNNPLKRDACVKMVKDMQENNVRIDGIGMQGHYYLSDYKANKEQYIKDFEDAIKAYTSLGLDVQITELEIFVDYMPSVSDLNLQAELYGKIFEICRKYSTPWQEGVGKVSNVTLWGSVDSIGKSYYLFNANHTPKSAFYEIIDF